MAFDQGIMPVHDSAQRQRAFADRADHLLAAGLDPLGDGDFALARQQLHGAHLAQIHAHRIVGAAEVLVLFGGGRGGGFGPGGSGLRRRLFRLLGLDNIDAELGELGHRVLDLLRGHVFGRQGRVQLVIGDVAAFLAARQQLLDRGAHRIDQRRVG